MNLGCCVKTTPAVDKSSSIDYTLFVTDKQDFTL